jgi:alpha-L-fucosidase
VNGEAIFKSKPWKHQNDTVSGGRVWYTRSLDGATVYAIALGWPNGDVLRLGAPKVNLGVTKMRMLGLDGVALDYKQSAEVTEINFPSMSLLKSKCPNGCNWGYVVAMTGLNNETPQSEAGPEAILDIVN